MKSGNNGIASVGLADIKFNYSKESSEIEQRQAVRSIILGFIGTVATLLTLTACSGNLYVDDNIDILKIGQLKQEKRILFDKCSVEVSEYEGASSVSLYDCPSGTLAQVVKNEEVLRDMKTNEIYVFAKNDTIRMDIKIQGKGNDVSDFQIWPPIVTENSNIGKGDS